MPKTVKRDITGNRFGRLVALEFVPDETKYARFRFRCDCGNVITALAQSVARGATKSCGCYSKEMTTQRATKHGHNRRSKRSGTYQSWAGMMDRGVWGGHPSFSRYGAIGIGVCERWHDYENFLADMGERPEGASIDRIDNSKGYSPDNCRWANRRQQSLNTTRTIWVVHNGETITFHDLCARLGLNKSAIRSRAIRRNNDYVKALLSVGVNVSVM